MQWWDCGVSDPYFFDPWSRSQRARQRSPSKGVLSRSCCIWIDVSRWEEHFGTYSTSLSQSNKNLSAKTYHTISHRAWCVPRCVTSVTFSGHNHGAWRRFLMILYYVIALYILQNPCKFYRSVAYSSGDNRIGVCCRTYEPPCIYRVIINECPKVNVSQSYIKTLKNI